MAGGGDPASGLFALLGFPFSAGSLVSLLLSGVASWVEAGAASLLRGLATLLDATTAPPLGGAFAREFALVGRLALALAPIFVVAVAIESLLRQDLSLLLRSVLLRLPIALVASGSCVAVVALLLKATDGISNSLLSLAGAPAASLVRGLVIGVGASTSSPAIAGFAAVLVAGLLALLALVLWIELAVRAAAISLALLFVPLVLLGLVMPATSHWVRRLGELLGALLFSKVVIAAVLALGIGSIGAPHGASGLVEGVALLLLAVLAPISVLRLVPLVEAGALAHLDGLAGRARRPVAAAWEHVPDALLPGGPPQPGPVSTPDIGMMAGEDFSGPEYEADVAYFRQFIADRAASAGGAETGSAAPDDGADGDE